MFNKALIETKRGMKKQILNEEWKGKKIHIANKQCARIIVVLVLPLTTKIQIHFMEHVKMKEIVLKF